MKEEQIDIQTSDGSMGTFITRPDRGGPFPIVLFLMDAPGKRKNYMTWLAGLQPLDIM